MKKTRLLCLLLSLLMLVGTFFTGCSEKEDDEALEGITDEASEATMTLAVHLMSETDLYKIEKDEEGNEFTQAQRIEDAVNKITKSQFKTQLNLYFYEEDEYYKKLEEKFAARKQAEASGELYKKETTAVSGETEEATEAETIVGDDGIVELVYPTIREDQVDIFYLSGYEKFKEYKNANMLMRMDMYFTNVAMLLGDYIAPGFISGMSEMNDGTYALPTGKIIGEYTYLLLNKNVLKESKYYSGDAEFKTDGFSSLVDEGVQDVLDYTNAYLSDEYVPLYSNTNELDVLGYKYWGVDKKGALSDNFSVMGGNYDVSLNYNQKGAYTEASNLLANEKFKADVSILKSYVNKGYYDNNSETQKPFAVGYVKGGAELAETYAEDYVMIPVELPRLETEDLYENMFAVTYYTTEPSRAMEILTFLNTNTEIRNILCYGIEGANYKMANSKYKKADGSVYLDENEKEYQVVSPFEDNNYKMDINKTGNPLIVTPSLEDLPIIKSYATKQNRESLISQDMTFILTEDVNKEKLGDIRELSDEIYNELMDIMDDKSKSVEDLVKFIDDAAKDVAENESFKFHINDKQNGSFAAIYKKWCLTKKVMN